MHVEVDHTQGQIVEDASLGRRIFRNYLEKTIVNYCHVLCGKLSVIILHFVLQYVGYELLDVGLLLLTHDLEDNLPTLLQSGAVGDFNLQLLKLLFSLRPLRVTL